MAASFPPVRACIFDVDGTLINSEDIYSEIYNNILREYGKPDYPWKIKATQQSRGKSGTQRLLDWAQVPLSMDEWKCKEKAYTHLFTKSEVLPGVEKLLSTLSTKTSPPVKLSLASSAGHCLFDLKTSHIPSLAAAFTDTHCHIFGDDPEMAHSDKKPCPDIFLLALKRLNNTCVVNREPELSPDECLVFEDSVAGVEAGRKAGMRVIWVPHPGLAEVCRGREMDVLMGRTEVNGQPPNYGAMNTEAKDLVYSNGLISEDGWAEMRTSLEYFPYDKYGVSLQHAG